MGIRRPWSRGPARSPRLLVADDDAALRAVVRVALAAQGWEVLEASSPDEAVARATAERPDVVLLDVTFGDHVRDGFGVCRQLRSQAATKDVPIVLFTAHDDAEYRAFGSAVGATAYLVKPFGPLDLLRMLRLVQGPRGGEPGLGLYLIDAGVISPEQLERALAKQRLRQGSKVPLGQLLVELGLATPGAVRLALERQRRSRENPQAPRLPIELRVVIADDHASVRDGLRSAIAAEDGLNVVGVAGDGDEALRQIRLLQPDLVVLDNGMPVRTGLEVLRAISAELPRVAIVMFTLDEAIRREALAAGAAAVVPKDSPLRVLIAELRRAASTRLAESAATPSAVLAAQSVALGALGALVRQKRGLAAMGVLGVAYAGAFLVVEPVLGASAAVLAVVPVALAGALLGPEVGIAEALLAAVLTALLWQGTGHPVGEPILTIGGNGMGFLALMGLGAGFGTMRALRGRIDRDARRAGALAEAAMVLATGSGPEVLHLLTAAALEVVPGDAALLFLPVPTGGLELVAGTAVPATLLGSRATGIAVARAQVGATAAIVAADATSIGVAIPRMRAAIVTPLGAVGGPPAGVLAVLSTRSDPYREAHLEALVAYAGFARLAIAARAEASDARVMQNAPSLVT